MCNCDEAEPGTFKDHMLLEETPHQIIEGMLLGAYAIGCAPRVHLHPRRVQARLRDLAGRASRRRAPPGTSARICSAPATTSSSRSHRGAGAYICGEETGLLNSLEGKRGEPRLKPPFPAVKGLYGEPTVVNNVETLGLPARTILRNGPEWFAQAGTEKSPGYKVVSISGHVKKPGNYESAARRDAAAD